MSQFLPVTKKDMEDRGWDQVDFVYVTGDAYVDHSSFGTAIISRLLESRGYKVGIIPQPDWRRKESIAVFGEPRLGFLVSAGNMDSMVNHYTVAKKRRQMDAYTPGGVIGKRPDYADVVYGNYNLGDLWEKVNADNKKENNREQSLIKKAALFNKKWYLIQVNSDAMFREELGKIQNTWLLVFVICLLCALGLSLSLSHSITKPIAGLIKSMGKVSQGNFNIQVEKPDNKDLAELVESFNTMILEVDVLMQENIQKEHEKTRMEMLALNAKINSHFLYNTLNTIKWQAISKSQMDIANSIVALTKILEYSCKNTLDMVALREEIQFIEDYIYIQNMRYGSSVVVKYQIEDDCRECLVLKMLLQPIVENALIHAFDNSGEGNVITVTCKKNKGHMKISVYDNGRGFQYEGFDKLTGIGLSNIKDRLELNFGTESEMQIYSVIGEGTRVTIVFPIVEGGKAAYESLTDRRR